MRLLNFPTKAGRVQTSKMPQPTQRTMEKWKRKDLDRDTMEIVVSNFKLDGSVKGEWECVRRGKGKTFLSLLMFGEKLSQPHDKIEISIHYSSPMNRQTASCTSYHDDCNRVARLKTDIL